MSMISSRSGRWLAVAPVAVVAALALTGCGNSEHPSDQPPGVGALPPVFTPSPAPSAIAAKTPTSDVGVLEEYTVAAVIKDASGSRIGTATFQGSGEVTRVTVEVEGLAPGFHNVSVNSDGKCDAVAGFESAGAVLAGTPSGGASAAVGGQLPTLLVATDGTGTMVATTSGFKVRDLTGANGTSLVIGSTGGERVACGVNEHS